MTGAVCLHSLKATSSGPHLPLWGVGGQGCSGGVVWDPSHTGFRSPQKHICIHIYIYMYVYVYSGIYTHACIHMYVCVCNMYRIYVKVDLLMGILDGL